MRDEEKTREQLLIEIDELRYKVEQVTELSRQNEKAKEMEIDRSREYVDELVKGQITELVMFYEQVQQEVNQRAKTEKALEAANEFARNIVDTIHYSLLVLNEDMKIIAANRFFYLYFKLLPEETEQQPFFEVGNRQWDIPDLKEKLTKVPFNDRTLEGFLVDHYFPGIGHRILLLNAYQLSSDVNQKKPILLAIEDVTERKKTEYELETAKNLAESANEAKSTFLANMSHELRTPLHGILSFSGFGLENIDRPKEKLLKYFNRIHTAGDRLLLLVDDLLDLSKLESDKMVFEMQKVDALKIADDCVLELSAYAEKQGVNLIIEPPVKNPVAVMDRFKFGQVIRNLLSNAIKFTPQGNNILIKFNNVDFEFENHQIPGIFVSVIDEGIGIPNEELNQIFEKFAQSSKTRKNSGGTGLGLSICREIVKAHSGRIWAENNPDIGARINILMPCKQPPIESE